GVEEVLEVDEREAAAARPERLADHAQDRYGKEGDEQKGDEQEGRCLRRRAAETGGERRRGRPRFGGERRHFAIMLSRLRHRNSGKDAQARHERYAKGTRLGVRGIWKLGGVPRARRSMWQHAHDGPQRRSPG